MHPSPTENEKKHFNNRYMFKMHHYFLINNNNVLKLNILSVISCIVIWYKNLNVLVDKS